MAHTFNFRTRKAETVGSQGLSASQPNLPGEFQANERPYIKKKKSQPSVVGQAFQNLGGEAGKFKAS